MNRAARSLSWVLALAATHVVVGCQKASGPVNMVSPVSAPSAWDTVLKEHTRRSQSYVIPSLEVDLRATLVTPRLRSAYIAARERFHGRIGEDLEDELAALGKKPDEGVDGKMLSGPDAEQHVLVFVAIFVRDQRYRDLSVSSSIWDVALARGAARVAPSSVDRVRVDPGLQGVFPFVDRFDQAYLVRFPLVDAATGTAMLSPGGDPVTLTVASALGKTQAGWTLVGDGVSKDDVSSTKTERNPDDAAPEDTRLPDKKPRTTEPVEADTTPSTDAAPSSDEAGAIVEEPALP